MADLLQRYADKIDGVISCFDRVVIQGTLPQLCYAEGMTGYLNARKIRIFDYPRFAQPFRDRLRDNAESIAAEHGVEITFVRRASTRKEKLVADILTSRGNAPGLVCILSAMERCNSYKPWFDRKNNRAKLLPTDGKCLHYYFYFIDADYGLCYARIPTWCPFRLQVYFNGHGYLDQQLSQRTIAHSLVDNAFVKTDDFTTAQTLADELDVRKLHHFLDRLANRCCPVLADLGATYHWSLMQVEYATDIIFHKQQDLESLYEAITRSAIHAVKADQVATFLGRKLTGNVTAELGGDFSTRIQGTRIRHHRLVEHRDGSSAFKLAPLRKSFYSLHALRELMLAANMRYLEFISTLDDPQDGIRSLDKVTRPVRQSGRTYKGFNFFLEDDIDALLAVVAGQNAIRGFRSRDLIQALPDLSSSQRSRLIKRLRTHGIVKKVAYTYKYYLSSFGKRVIAAGLHLKTFLLAPQLCATAAG